MAPESDSAKVGAGEDTLSAGDGTGSVAERFLERDDDRFGPAETSGEIADLEFNGYAGEPTLEGGERELSE